jgi:hypothetical protein
MSGDPAPAREESTPSPIAGVLVVVGLAVLAVSLVVPYATNEADCLDHCAAEGRYFVWHPLHNPGAPLLLVGTVSSVLPWRSARWRRRVLTWLGAVSGWIGLYLLYRYGPAVVAELYLYGGPELELESTRWIVAAGWSVLQVGTVVHALPLLQGTASLQSTRGSGS